MHDATLSSFTRTVHQLQLQVTLAKKQDKQQTTVMGFLQLQLLLEKYHLWIECLLFSDLSTGGYTCKFLRDAIHLSTFSGPVERGTAGA